MTWCLRVRYLFAACVAYLSFWVFAAYRQSRLPHDQRRSAGHVSEGIFVTSTPIICFLAIFKYITVDTSELSNQVSLFMFVSLLRSLSHSAGALDLLSVASGPCEALVDSIACVFLSALVFSQSNVVKVRLELSERAFRRNLGSRYIAVGGLVAAGPCILTSLGIFFEPNLVDSKGNFFNRYRLFTCQLVPIAAFANTAWFAGRGFTALHSSLQIRDKRCGRYLRSEASWAQFVIWRTGLATLVTCATGCFYCVSQGLTAKSGHFTGSPGCLIFIPLLVLTETACQAVMLGNFSPTRTLQIQNSRLDSEADHCSQLESLPLLAPQASSDSVWSAKVRTLAHRSVSVATLLEFYDRLGSDTFMVHYDLLQHTTNDVVRCAIIPSTRNVNGGVAYADLYPGTDTPAAFLVTHSWSNLFVHLVAAVVAAALGLDEYHSIVDRIAGGNGHDLRTELKTKGTYHIHCWICCFCVNQHASICGGFGPEPNEDPLLHRLWDRGRRDTVTGEVFQCCTCSETKHFNDSPDECELNKFEDVMSLLRTEVPNFKQVIAFDSNLELLSRAWCIAEIVQASSDNVPQHIVMHSHKDLDTDAEDLSLYWKLTSMTVADCQSSRPEDKEFILSKIPDIPDFDAHLQLLIFGSHGLFGRQFQGFDVIEAAASTARRLNGVSQLSTAAHTNMV